MAGGPEEEHGWAGEEELPRGGTTYIDTTEQVS